MHINPRIYTFNFKFLGTKSWWTDFKLRYQSYVYKPPPTHTALLQQYNFWTIKVK